jgi:hypothetical protein
MLSSGRKEWENQTAAVSEEKTIDVIGMGRGPDDLTSKHVKSSTGPMCSSAAAPSRLLPGFPGEKPVGKSR